VQTTFNTSIGPATEFLYGKRADMPIGFGCASLMRLPSRRRRQSLLGAAFDHGIRHFDVARMYGLGMAERELGRFARGRRDEIAIATKFGIDSSGVAGRLAALQAPARAAIARFAVLRARLKRRQGHFHAPRRYDAASARRSLETSLRELGTDYVDILFVHDPTAGSLPDMEELVEALEALTEAGRIRAWGVSGEPDPSLPIVSAWPRCVPQLRHDIFSFAPDLDPEGIPPILFGVLSGALDRIHERLEADAATRATWGRATGVDCGDRTALAALLLQDALAHNPRGGVLFASTSPERIASATAAARARGAGVGASLTALRRLIAATSWESDEAPSEVRDG
jgi:D-threo-aldose 1-dehydrogenase